MARLLTAGTWRGSSQPVQCGSTRTTISTRRRRSEASGRAARVEHPLPFRTLPPFPPPPPPKLHETRRSGSGRGSRGCAPLSAAPGSAGLRESPLRSAGREKGAAALEAFGDTSHTIRHKSKPAHTSMHQPTPTRTHTHTQIRIQTRKPQTAAAYTPLWLGQDSTCRDQSPERTRSIKDLFGRVGMTVTCPSRRMTDR